MIEGDAILFTCDKCGHHHLKLETRDPVTTYHVCAVMKHGDVSYQSPLHAGAKFGRYVCGACGVPVFVYTLDLSDRKWGQVHKDLAKFLAERLKNRAKEHVKGKPEQNKRFQCEACSNAGISAIDIDGNHFPFHLINRDGECKYFYEDHSWKLDHYECTRCGTWLVEKVQSLLDPEVTLTLPIRDHGRLSIYLGGAVVGYKPKTREYEVDIAVIASKRKTITVVAQTAEDAKHSARLLAEDNTGGVIDWGRGGVCRYEIESVREKD
jgi:hypothetical protein